MILSCIKSITEDNAIQRPNRLTPHIAELEIESAEETKGILVSYLRYHTVTHSGIAPIGCTTKNPVNL